jgi:7,8-dihydropterin-6-yl-methyl-4-(beta-D-ribofuranosyl)aminobenzene 5'-phosphate synthase
MQTDWGYSCLIEGTEKKILFDAGTKPDVFFSNVETLGVDLSDVEIVVISHEHGDHTGALPRVLEDTTKVSVYHPVSFSDEFVQSVKQGNATPIPVDQPVEICKDVYLTGEMGDDIKEQSLIMKTGAGLVVITGCSHPGIVQILERTKKLHDEDIYMAFGGFHLMRHSDEAVSEIIRRFKQLGVKRCGAMHCTGDEQIESFKEAYSESFIPMGVGKVLTFESPRRPPKGSRSAAPR